MGYESLTNLSRRREELFREPSQSMSMMPACYLCQRTTCILHHLQQIDVVLLDHKAVQFSDLLGGQGRNG